MGKGDLISITNHAWIPGSSNYWIISLVRNCNVELVADLISSNREWNRELVTSSFDAVDANRILRIPLAKESDDDIVIWRCEASSEFSVRSAYKLLHSVSSNPELRELQNKSRDFYRKL